MVDPQLLQIAIIFLAALAVGGVVYVLVYPYLTGEKKANKRRASAATGHSGIRARAGNDVLSTRKKEVQETIKELEAKQKSKKRATLQVRLTRAGLNVPARSYWIASVLVGIGVGLVVLISGSSPLVSAGAGFVGAFGIPRWLLGHMTKRRQAKFLKEFANAIDIIVRGVKSGLPLNDCLQIIAAETPEPVKGEFEDLVEQQRVGVPLSKAFERMYERVPLQEVNFFAIVIAIQQKIGGNLAEALGNLSQVLRERHKLQAKVQAFSAEAKSSAAIIGALPPCVMVLIYLTTPRYIELLWTEELGNILLAASAVWMLIGVLVMRKMINFDY
ncbi:MAG: type II secretion system F family protein [Methyloligellaceae bacterium]